jgi:hypothetical protein
MKNNIITLMICLTLVFAMASLVDAKIINKCDFNTIDTGINNLLNKINSNTNYTDFIANSNYSAVKVVIDRTHTYYFIYDSEAKQAKQVEGAQENFTIKATCKQIEKVIKDSSSDSPKLNRAILNRIPMKVKSNLIGQCFKTEWCTNKILGK